MSSRRVGILRFLRILATALTPPVPTSIPPLEAPVNNHFGFALAFITATVIGGALVVDRFMDKSPEPAAIATPAKSETSVADTSTNGSSAATVLADVGKEASKPSAPVEPAPQV